MNTATNWLSINDMVAYVNVVIRGVENHEGWKEHLGSLPYVENEESAAEVYLSLLFLYSDYPRENWSEEAGHALSFIAAVIASLGYALNGANGWSETATSIAGVRLNTYRGVA
jgi:hypothetical protein